jgi:hypothetical protein
MKRWYFNEKNGDATLLFDAETEEEAIERAKELLIDVSAFRLEEGEEEEY